ncbi:MAG: hypothetical protein GX085_04200 [Firmicutes bacterium]|nr:hypothetical protein [Bacillota bacterium]
MKNILLPPLTEAPPSRSARQDFKLLLATQVRVTWNTLRHWPVINWIVTVFTGFALLWLMVFLGMFAYGAFETTEPGAARGLLSLLFMAGLAGQVFFGVAAAFAALYTSADLELLFVAPVSIRAVFAVKSLVVAGSNFLPVFIFILLPGIFYGLFFSAGPLFYFWVALTGIGLWATGTALAELLNLAVMRIVPPHRSREAASIISGVTGIIIVLLFQMPNLILTRGGNIDPGAWLSGQDQLLQVMNWFPWGWASLALANGATGNHPAALGWSLLPVLLGAALFSLTFPLLERGFRRGWIALGEGGGRRRKKRRGSPGLSGAQPMRKRESAVFTTVKNGVKAALSPIAASGSAWRGMWAVARKDLLQIGRDTREWFGILTPLIITAFFVAQHLIFNIEYAKGTLAYVVFLYMIIFSGNMAMRAFGREGEAEWVLNSVPLAGWPVVWGKLLASALPTLVMMEALLAGTAAALGFSPSVIIAMAVGAVFISLGASAMGLFFSINNSRYNPENSRYGVSSGTGMLMFLLNMVFALLLGLGVIYLFPPAGLLAAVTKMPRIPFTWGFPEILFYIVSMLLRPLLWPPVLRVLWGILYIAGVWGTVFFGFIAATVHRSQRGFQVKIVTTAKRKRRAANF